MGGLLSFPGTGCAPTRDLSISPGFRASRRPLPAKPAGADAKVVADGIRHHEEKQKTDNPVCDAQKIETPVAPVNDARTIPACECDGHEEPVRRVHEGEQRSVQGYRCEWRHEGDEAIQEIPVQDVLLQEAPWQISGERQRRLAGAHRPNGAEERPYKDEQKSN